MMYILNRNDGAVSLMSIVPNKLVIDDITYHIAGYRGGKIHLTDVDGVPLGVVDFKTDSWGDVEPDSMSGAKFEFPGVEKEIARWETATGHKCLNYVPVKRGDLPEDQTYFNAWKHDGKKIIHDMTKAREVFRDMVREKRGPILAALDVEFMRALELDDKTALKNLKDKKQILRDLTKHSSIDAAQTIEQLKSIKLKELE